MLAAYPSAPKDGAGREAYYKEISKLDISGLEVPLPPDGQGTLEAVVENCLRPNWDVVITCIPTVVGKLVSNPNYGLASRDEAGRTQALLDVSRARDLAQQLVTDQHSVFAIEVHSAPGPKLGSARALERSLDEILDWDFAGAAVLVEHCDALVPGQEAAKGFFTLRAEISAIERVAKSCTNSVGVSINWGRSAIEGRSAEMALDHIKFAADSGLLKTLFFSGATAEETAWGSSWDDQHIPPRPTKSGSVLDASKTSLLGAAEIEAALRSIDPSVRVGLKISGRPRDADVSHKVETLKAGLDLLYDAS